MFALEVSRESLPSTGRGRATGGMREAPVDDFFPTVDRIPAFVP